MKILAIETSTDVCSVAVLYDKEVLQRHDRVPRQHGRVILSWIESLLAEAGLTLTQLDTIAFSKGPGSFTGIRIAASVVQGLAFAADLSVVSVSSLNALAQTAYKEMSCNQVLIAQDARMNEVYWGVYRLNKTNSIMEASIEDQLCYPKDIAVPEITSGWFAAGQAWNVYPELKQECQWIDRIDADLYPHARDVAKIGMDLFNKGLSLAPEAALPVYLRPHNTWKKINEQ